MTVYKQIAPQFFAFLKNFYKEKIIKDSTENACLNSDNKRVKLDIIKTG